MARSILEIILKAVGAKQTAGDIKNVGGSVGGLDASFDDFSSSLGPFNLGLTGAVGGIAAVTLAAGAGVLKLSEIGAESLSAARTFENLSGGAMLAADNLAAMDRATKGLTDTTSQQQIASQLLGMNIVQTADQLEQVVGVSRRLGKEFQGLGTAEAANEFAIMIANMSVARLDSFGLSSGRVRQRIDELLASGQAVNREDAFFQATMEEAEKTIGRLGPEMMTSQEALAGLGAEWGNFVSVVGESVEQTGAVSGLFESMATGVSKLSEATQEAKAGFQTFEDSTEFIDEALERAGGTGNKFADAILKGAESMSSFLPAAKGLEPLIKGLVVSTTESEQLQKAASELKAEQKALEVQTQRNTAASLRWAGAEEGVNRALANQAKQAATADRQARAGRRFQDIQDEMAGTDPAAIGRAKTRLAEQEQLQIQVAESAAMAQEQAASTAASAWESKLSNLKGVVGGVLGEGIGTLGDLGLEFISEDTGRAVGENARRLAAIAAGDFAGEAASLLEQSNPELFRRVMESEDPAALAQKMVRDFSQGIGVGEIIGEEGKEAAKEKIRRIILGTADTEALVNEITNELMAEGFAAQQIAQATSAAGLAGGEETAEQLTPAGAEAFAGIETGLLEAAAESNVMSGIAELFTESAAVADYGGVGAAIWTGIKNAMFEGPTAGAIRQTFMNLIIENLVASGAFPHPGMAQP